MEAVLSKRPLDRFTPDSYKADGVVPPDAPVYLVAPLSYRDRAGYRGAVAAAGLRYPGQPELLRTVREAITDLAPGNADVLLSQVEAYADWLAAQDAPPEPAEAAETAEEKDELAAEAARQTSLMAAFEALVDLLRIHPAVSRLLSLRTTFLEMAPWLAAAAALRGVENVAVPFRRVAGIVPDDVLEELPEADVRAIGARAMELFNVSAAQQGN